MQKSNNQNGEGFFGFWNLVIGAYLVLWIWDFSGRIACFNTHC
jgi:hypothetical protein